MKLTTILYQTFIKGYKLFPFKSAFCHAIKFLGLPVGRIHVDLKFKGPFRLRLNEKCSITVHHFGGTIENELFWYGIRGKNEDLKLWMKLCENAQTILDIGANTGMFSLAAKAVVPNSRVAGFEPVPWTYEYFKTNVKSNGFDIQVFDYAVSDQTGTQTFYLTPLPTQTSSSLSAQKNKEWEGFKGEIQEVPVSTITLDGFLEKHDFPDPDLMKIDVEMHEPAVLRGMQKLLSRKLPIFFIEILTDKIGEEVEELLKPYGYHFYHIDENTRLCPITHLKAKPGYWNFVLSPTALDIHAF